MGFFWVILAIVVISTVVGAIAKLFNNLNEANAANAARQRQAAQGGAAAGNNAGGAVRPANSDMDRFLAEIDRLRKKTAEAPPPPQNQAPAVPVVQPARQPDRPRPRVVAELVDLPKPDQGFGASPSAQGAQATQAAVAVAAVTAPSGETGAPATRVTRLASRPRPVAKTPFAKNLTALLNSGQGLALAIVLQEILGPARCKK